MSNKISVITVVVNNVANIRKTKIFDGVYIKYI